MNSGFQNYLFVGGPLSGKVELLPTNIQRVKAKDGEHVKLVYKKVSLRYGNKSLEIVRYDIFTPNGDQSNELMEEFKRQLPHLLERL